MVSCNSKQKAKSICAKSVTYIDQRKALNPSAIRIEILDSVETIRKAAESEKIKKVIFYSIDKEQREFFSYLKFRESKTKGSIVLVCLTSIYDADKKKNWSAKEVENQLKKNIGIVIGNDTLKINGCK